MRFPGFIGPSYKLSSVDVDCQRCVNLYPEIDELQTGKDHEVASLVGTPGLTLLQTLGTSPLRGYWYTTTGVLYAVAGNTLYKIDSSWTATTIGTLSTASGQVDMADNGTQLVIVDGANGYYVVLSGSTLVKITDAAWLGSNKVAYLDGYFIFVKPSSNEFYLSPLSDITKPFDGTLVASKEGYPDNIISHACVHRNLWFFGDQTTEVWYNAGASGVPFQRIEGTFMEYGCAATFSVAKIANTIFWLGKDSTGTGMVLLANGYSPQRISTHAIEEAIQGYSTISDAVAYCYQENGHNFYVLNFPTGNATWVYDTTTSLWHERAYNNNGSLDRHRGVVYAYAYGSHIVGDWSTGQVYKMDSSVYSDNGVAITRMRVTPHLSQDMHRIFYSKMQLDLEAGTGIDGTGQGTSPQAMLQWSNDGGHTWSNEFWVGIGAIGQTKARAIWRRLGQSRSRVFKVTITDPVKVRLIGAEIELQEGAA